MTDSNKCKKCQHFCGLPHIGPGCEGCYDNNRFSRIECPPDPEILIVDCLKNIEKTLSLIAKQQDNINERMSILSTAVECNSKAILLLNQRIDNRLEES